MGNQPYNSNQSLMLSIGLRETRYGCFYLDTIHCSLSFHASAVSRFGIIETTCRRNPVAAVSYQPPNSVVANQVIRVLASDELRERTRSTRSLTSHITNAKEMIKKAGLLIIRSRRMVVLWLDFSTRRIHNRGTTHSDSTRVTALTYPSAGSFSFTSGRVLVTFR